MNDDLVELHLLTLAAAGCAPDSTIRRRREVLHQLHRALPLGLLYATTSDLAAWLGNPSWSRCTRRTYHYHVKMFYAWATAEEFLARNPMLRLPSPPTPVLLPRPASEEIIALLLAQPEPLPTIAVLGAFGGLRRAEMAACWRDHVTADLITIPVAKGGNPQTVPCHPLIWAHVRDLAPGPLLRNRGGRQMTPDQLGGYWRRARRRLGLPETLVPHQLRHRFGTVIQREGGDLRVTQECLRHASVQSTQRYTLVTGSQRRAAVDLLPAA